MASGSNTEKRLIEREGKNAKFATGYISKIWTEGKKVEGIISEH